METWEQNARNAYVDQRLKDEEATQERRANEASRNATALRIILKMVGITSNPSDNFWADSGYTFSINYDINIFLKVNLGDKSEYIPTGYGYRDVVGMGNIGVNARLQALLGEALVKLDRPEPEKPAVVETPAYISVREQLLNALDEYLQSGEWHS